MLDSLDVLANCLVASPAALGQYLFNLSRKLMKGDSILTLFNKKSDHPILLVIYELPLILFICKYLVHWQRVYTSHLSPSGQLVQYLDSNWSKYRSLHNPEFQDTIQAFQDYNISATHKDDIRLCRDGCAALLAKMSK